MKKITLLLLLLFLLPACKNLNTNEASKNENIENFDVFTLEKLVEENENSCIEKWIYTFPDGDIIEWGRVYFSEKAKVLFETETSEIKNLYASKKTWWQSYPIKNCSISDGWIFADTNDEHYMFLTPRYYKFMENSGLKNIVSRNGCLSIKELENKFSIALKTPSVMQGGCCDYMIMKSKKPLANFKGEPGSTGSWYNWMPFDNKTSWRWTFDGYYFESASTYIPNGENVFTNLPACYLLPSFLAISEQEPAAQKLSLCIAFMQIQHRDERGFIPSLSKSTWLYNDYGIDANYYDTRFNSDFARDCIKLYKKTKANFLYDYLKNYAEFFENMAKETAWSNNNGCWIPDYWTDKPHKTPHTALNHQLAEIMVLYDLQGLLKQKSLGKLADKMLLAIEESAQQWIMPDYNLEYAILPNGNFGFSDYPYLTYNDLFDMQKILKEKKGKKSSKLQLLMDAKKNWMDKNNITQYKQ